MINNIQEEVDTYEGMGLPALQKLQQQNPKLLVGIALENLEKTVQEDQRAKLMGTGEVGPSVIDKKLMGLGGLGQQQALAAASPGLQQRGKQMQAAQMRKAMGMQPGMQPGMQQAPMRMAGGGVVGFKPGGKIEGGFNLGTPIPIGNNQPIPMLMQKYGSEKVMEFLEGQKELREESKFVAPEYRDAFKQKEANFMSRFGDMVRDIRQAQSGPDEMAGGGVVALKEGGFPDLSGDGKVTQKDVLMGRGVVNKAQGGVIGFNNRGLVRADDIDMENLLDALMVAESGGDPNAISSVGAEGAYQIMPSTAAQPGFGVSPMEGSRFDSDASRSFAREYLQAMIDRYDGDIEAALIAYNAGAGNADKFISAGRDYEVLPLAMQTQPYVRKILGQMEGQSDEERRRGVNVSPGLAAAERRRILRNNPAIGSLRGVGRRQDQSAQGGIGYLQSIGRKQEEEAKRASNFLKMMQGQEDMIARANPATNLEGIDINEEFVVEGGMESPAQRMSQAFPGAANAAARYAMSPKDTAPQKTRGNNLFTNVRDDFSEILDFVQGLFNEGGEVKGFQEGDLVELEGGEQVVPISNITDDQGLIDRGIQYVKDNPYEAASIGLMLIPGIGLVGRGALAAAKFAPRGLAALRQGAAALKQKAPGAYAGAKDFVRGTTSTPASGNIFGRAAQKAYTRPRKTGMGSAVKGPKGQVSAKDAKKQGLRLNREFSPSRATMAAGAGAYGLENILGVDDETVAQNPEALTDDMQRLQQELPNVYAGLKQGVSKYAQDKATRSREGAENARNRMQGRGGQGDRGGILSRLGSALSSDRANSLYDAFQTLGMAGGAARGQEGTQLIANQMARDFQQQEMDTMRERIDVDREAFATQERLAQFNLIQSLVGSVTFDTLAQEVAEELGESTGSAAVQNETLKRLLGAINSASPGLFIGDGGATGGGGLGEEQKTELEAYLNQ
tara:strand:- start:828 stop:3698 length:2871 start_codon:yes stop_codon:yes gene_type:complete